LSQTPQDLAGAAVGVLTTADAAAKAAAGRAAAKAWRDGRIAEVGRANPPERPARPPRPELKPPREVPRRSIGAAPKGRIALLHALAHIELNAVDLAWDLIARFSGPDSKLDSKRDLPRAFFDDWVAVADDEARHFTLLTERLAALGAAYGDLPAHDGLWQAASDTRHDLLARLAVVPLVLEARGLDVTPAMIAKLEAAGDRESAGLLQVIYRDEIGHVAAGKRWFDWACARAGREPAATWRALVARHFKGTLKPPFNEAARRAAGLTPETYGPLATG
jgi:uncharacterized ferritin-like protein (DUF455 family)